MAASLDDYATWLSEKLISLNPDVDREVFVSYISSILDTDSPSEEKKDDLEGIISEITDDSAEICDELIAKWEELQKQKVVEQDTKGDVDVQLSKIVSNQKLTVSKARELTDEERARKAAILAQYSHVTEGNDSSEEEEDPGGAAGGGDNSVDQIQLLARNLNRVDIDRVEREKRDKARREHEQKKEKDKQDRDAQKAKAQDRKDTEKKRTQKGERRR